MKLKFLFNGLNYLPQNMNLASMLFLSFFNCTQKQPFTCVLQNSCPKSLEKSKKQPPQVVHKKDVFKTFIKFTGKHLCRSLIFNKEAFNFIEKETPILVFSCEFCENINNTFFTNHLWTIASETHTKPCAIYAFLIRLQVSDVNAWFFTLSSDITPYWLV